MVQLHPSLSFCEVGDRHVFLDLPGDRYFGLADDLEESWRAALRGDATPPQIAMLTRRELVVPSGGAPLQPCPASIPARSALDLPVGERSWTRAFSHLVAVNNMRRRLRRESLAHVVGALVQAKSGGSSRPRTKPSDLAAAAADFARLSLMTTTLDQCLSRSLAVGFHLARTGFEPVLVFGVRLGSFSAHCWIECEGLLINDRFERVGTYQPIRRL